VGRETIAAISTPAGIGAVGIVRISGPNAKMVLENVWISGLIKVENFITHRLYYGKISTDNRIIDNVLAVWMEDPHSYTGEDVVEIHCHGGSVSTKNVLNAILGGGAKPAAPGEFTMRAFLNRKLDLAQAEGVAEVISATSEKALRLASDQLNGKISDEVHGLLEGLKEVKALVEATIDFPEEDTELIAEANVCEMLLPVQKRIGGLLSTYNEGRLIHDGVRAVIVGKPNVGKSSVLNALIGNERAIVHHTPGTTRDTIEESMELGGILFSITDTAGIRESSCEIEKIGVKRSKEKLSSADIVLVVLDASRPLDKEDAEVLEETGSIERVILLNKSDIAENKDEETFDFDDKTKKISTSAVTGVGMEELKKALISSVDKDALIDSDGAIITNLRHKHALDEADTAIGYSLEVISKKESAEFVAHHIQAAMNALMKITGEVTTEDVLNSIFSKFCIGK